MKMGKIFARLQCNQLTNESIFGVVNFVRAAADNDVNQCVKRIFHHSLSQIPSAFVSCTSFKENFLPIFGGRLFFFSFLHFGFFRFFSVASIASRSFFTLIHSLTHSLIHLTHFESTISTIFISAR